MLDRYEGYEVKLLPDCSREELETWVEVNAAAVRGLLPADLVLCNHVLLGGAVGLATGAPYSVKAHGSELEYSMRGRPALEEWGHDVLADATAVFVGSQHIREVVEQVCRHVEHVHEVPPGVDVDLGVPRRARRRSRLSSPRRDSTRRIPPTRTSGFPTRATRSGSPTSSSAIRRRSSTSESSSATRACSCCSKHLTASTLEP